MAEIPPLSKEDWRDINALTVLYDLTGQQATYLYLKADKRRERVDAALLEAKLAREADYVGALKRMGGGA